MRPTQLAFDAAAEADDPFPWRFSRRLLANSQHFTVESVAGPINLVVENGYLQPDQIRRLGSEVARDRALVTAISGRDVATLPPLTIYVYGEHGPAALPGVPMSQASAPGPNVGDRAVFLRFVREAKAPRLHELVHTQEGDLMSESLSEGFADFVHYSVYPNRGVAFYPERFDVDALARSAVTSYPTLLTAVGSNSIVRFTDDAAALAAAPRPIARDGREVAMRRFFPSEARFGFYYASHSFVRYLVEQRGLSRYQALAKASGDPNAYREVYGTSFDELQAAWLRSIGATR